MRRKECQDRLEQVFSQYETASRMADVLIRLAEERPKNLQGYNLDPSRMRTVRDGFDEMYFTRMFAWFESDLRHYWRTNGKVTRPLTEQLLASIAQRNGIPITVLAAVDEVREFRNYLIHGEHEARGPITIDEARRRMNAFLTWLPRKW
jgi:hypothetical protein